MSSIDYEKVVNDLNQQLNEKYQSKELRNVFEDLSEVSFRTFFSNDKDQYGRDIIYFDKVIVFSRVYYSESEFSEEFVIQETKKWFNNYLDAMVKLKF